MTLTVISLYIATSISIVGLIVLNIYFSGSMEEELDRANNNYYLLGLKLFGVAVLWPVICLVTLFYQPEDNNDYL